MVNPKEQQLHTIDNFTASKPITWRCPSNLAIIKYWGKHGLQLPQNPSISFTLSAAHTVTSLELRPKEKQNREAEVSYLFDHKNISSFEKKVTSFLNTLIDDFGFIKTHSLHFESANSFPHSAGIASSASSMAAIALCLCSFQNQMSKPYANEDSFLNRASYIARLGSGSASRSVFDSIALWGEAHFVDGSSDLFAIPVKNLVDPVFHSFHDDICIVSQAEKSVSSTHGHKLMVDNPFAKNRYAQANQRLSTLLKAMREGDLPTFGKIAEDEALALHALMMLSDPSYILMHPNSLSIIHVVRHFRKKTNTPVYFSLDAGPNIHLLYPEKVRPFVKQNLHPLVLPYCENEKILEDKVGRGPIILSN